MRKDKKSRSILKGASFFLATFAFCGVMALCSRFIKPKNFDTYNQDIVAVAAVGGTAYIEYKNQDGTTFDDNLFVGDIAPITHTYGTATTLVKPTQSGYVFDGWYESSDFSGTALKEIPAAREGDDGDTITLYAKWEVAATLDKALWDQFNNNNKITILESVTKVTTQKLDNPDITGATLIGTDVYAKIVDDTLLIFSINNGVIVLPESCSWFFRYDTGVNDEHGDRNYSFKNVTEMDLRNFNTSKVENMENMFGECKSLVSLDLSNFDTSKVKRMDYTFYNCQSLTSLDLSGFDTSKVTNMGYMFNNCSALTCLDLSNFDMTNVENASVMFTDCSSLTTIYTPKELSSDTNLTINLPATYGLTNDNYQTTGTRLNAFPVSTVGNKQQIVRQNSVTANVNNNSYGAVTGDLTYYAGQTITEDGNTLKVGDTVIATATPATIEGYTVEFDSWDLTALASSNTVTANFTLNANEYTFTFMVDGEQYEVITQDYGTYINVPTDPIKEGYTFAGWSESVPTYMLAEDKTFTAQWMDADTYTITVNGLENTDVYEGAIPSTYTIESESITLPTNVTREGYIFTGWTYEGQNEPTKNVAIPAGSTGDKTYTANFEAHATFDTALWETFTSDTNIDWESITNISTEKNTVAYIESGDRKIGEGVYARVSGVTLTIFSINESDIFMPDNCSCLFNKEINHSYIFENVTEIDLRYFNTTNVTDMNHMFADCESLNTLIFGNNFDTSNVTNMSSMFRYCLSLTSLDLSNFDTSNVTDMYNMFGEDENLESLDLSSFDMYAVENVGDIFNWCTALNQIYMPKVLPNSSVISSLQVDPYRDYFVTTTGERIVSNNLMDFPVSTVGNKQGITKFVAATLNLSYYDEDGYTYSGSSEVELPSTYSNDQTVVLPTPTKVGATFVGWYTDSACTNLVTNLEAYTYSADITLYAKWNEEEYSITTIVNGEITNQFSYTVSSEIEIVNPLAEFGYTFVGWTGGGLTNPTPDLVVGPGETGDKIFVAQFEGEKYNINYYNQYGQTFVGEGNLPLEHTYDKTTYLVNPTRAGYTFGGWYQDFNCTTQITKIDAFSTTSDVYVYAKWTSREYNINYRDQGNNVFTGSFENSYPTTFVYDQATSLTNSTRVGYWFAGWYTDSACTNQITQIPAEYYAGDVTLYAKWDAERYTIIYYDEGGATFTGSRDGLPTEHVYDQPTSLVRTTRTGYTFVGWYADYECTTPINQIGARTTTDSVSVYAKWQLNTYTINYFDQYRNEFTGTRDGLTTTFTYEDNVVFGTPTRDGYDFIGWYGDENCSYVNVDGFNAHQVAQNIEVFALWQKVAYNVTLEPNGGNIYGQNPIQVAFETEFGHINEPYRDHYTFAGWYLDSDLTQKIEQNTVYPYNHDTTIYAKWDLINYTITVDVEGEQTQINFNAETAPFTVTEPTKTGYTFTGWGKDSNWIFVGKNYNPLDNDFYNYTLFAIFEPTAYELTINADRVFEDEYGNSIFEIAYPDLFGQTHEYNIESSDITLPDLDLESYGLNFLGWTGEGVTTPTKNLTIPTGSMGDKTYIANFEGQKFVVRFDPREGQLLTKSILKEFGEEFGELPTPVRTNYDFIGWFDENEQEVKQDTLFLTNHDILLHAKYEMTNFRIVRNIDGITFVKTYNIESRRYTLPTPAKRGYVFVGWQEKGVEGLAKTVTIIKGSAGDREFTAVFEKAIYTITIRVNNQEEVRHYDIESEDITLDPVEVDGYEFIGWSGTELNTPSQTYTIEAGSVGDRVYTANLTPIEYTITLTNDGVDKEIAYNVATEDFEIENPTKNGFIFKGWREAGSDEVVTELVITKGTTGDKQYTAVWEKDKSEQTVAIALFSASGVVLATGVAFGVLKFVKRKKKF